MEPLSRCCGIQIGKCVLKCWPFLWIAVKCDGCALKFPLLFGAGCIVAIATDCSSRPLTSCPTELLAAVANTSPLLIFVAAVGNADVEIADVFDWSGCCESGCCELR